MYRTCRSENTTSDIENAFRQKKNELNSSLLAHLKTSSICLKSKSLGIYYYETPLQMLIVRTLMVHVSCKQCFCVLKYAPGSNYLVMLKKRGCEVLQHTV